jgi:hypothetical protein
MNTVNHLELPAYVADLVYTIVFVFQRVIPPDMLMQWLEPMLMDEEQCALLMHEEPVYVAADFLGIDRQSPSFSHYEMEYLNFRANFLHRKQTPLPRSMERSLSYILPKARSYLQRIAAGRDVGAPDFSSKHSSARHSDDRAEVATPSKLMPHHRERSFSPKFRHRDTTILGRNKRSRRTARSFTAKHVTEDLSEIG